MKKVHMLLKFAINLRKLQDGVVLPRKMAADVIFYEVVIRSGSEPILRIPFTDQTTWKVELYDSDSEICASRERLSMLPHVARYDASRPIRFHACKVIKDIDTEEGPIIDRLGFVTHITEDTSSCQDLPFLEFFGTRPPRTPYLVGMGLFPDVPPLRKISELRLKERSSSSPLWYTQRAFHSRSHVTLNDFVHLENLELMYHAFFLRFRSHVFKKGLLDMLQTFAMVMIRNRIKYKPDESFARTGEPADAGDLCIERSSKGDCEDHGNMYMRLFRTLVSVFEYFVPDKESDLYKQCRTLADNYVCLQSICQVMLDGERQFHSTMLIVPKSDTLPVISFEVTNPKTSYVLPSATYSEWHMEHYFVVDNFCIARVDDIELGRVSIDDLDFFNY